MKRITVICIEKNGSGIMTEAVEVGTKEATKEQLDEISAKADAAYGCWRWEAETDDCLTSEEIEMLAELDIEII